MIAPSFSNRMSGDEQAVNRSDEPERLQQPHHDRDDHDHANDLLDGSIHRDDVDEVQHQADDDERNDDADDGRAEHTVLLHVWMREMRITGKRADRNLQKRVFAVKLP